ncbi:hypothetical protein DIU31_031555 [Mucilaginibacter rubeus]|uniref:Uncharacterized protein n=1 Tax=Mucilaginibacter rubeus TaxID=2027860 RepID=A0AAE6MLF8_9SPHI|nr:MULTISPECIES: hypothetical protein [Mucilaginibacter]QEM07818.1 hypothetical protein DIU31_031555 [Mucilaginibacter rubeus]QEM20270.1 hypothetical protein DIU38_031160 [Mucilaginibacter gossypii]QTE43013.1 hypothetical protein J3L19_29510 [Mucilaginibacter rubeus]QTE49614.1 hypothetical protein J3L21_29470 [Mucilaginibacter rubeus]QTE54709.1 hypothetical protein J3L23_21090 [Mucilaginibacter rubeus]
MKTNTYKVNFLIIAINLFINIVGITAAVTFALVKSILIINVFTYCLLLYVIYCYRQAALFETRDRLQGLLDTQRDHLRRHNFQHLSNENFNFLLLQYGKMMQNLLEQQVQSGYTANQDLKEQIDGLNERLESLI